jgi:hypothetical protein
MDEHIRNLKRVAAADPVAALRAGIELLRHGASLEAFEILLPIATDPAARLALENFPCWSQRRGTSGHTRCVDVPLPGSRRMGWTRELGFEPAGLLASPVAVIAYGSDFVIAMDPQTGKELWRKNVGCRAAVNVGGCCVVRADETLSSLDALTGSTCDETRVGPEIACWALQRDGRLECRWSAFSAEAQAELIAVGHTLYTCGGKGRAAAASSLSARSDVIVHVAPTGEPALLSSDSGERVPVPEPVPREIVSVSLDECGCAMLLGTLRSHTGTTLLSAAWSWLWRSIDGLNVLAMSNDVVFAFKRTLPFQFLLLERSTGALRARLPLDIWASSAVAIVRDAVMVGDSEAVQCFDLLGRELEKFVSTDTPMQLALLPNRLYVLTESGEVNAFLPEP